MNEDLLQYAWQCKLFKLTDLHTTEGIPVEIIDVGQLNKDAGPDFFNAKIKIGNTIWAGNIEIHTLASDWYRHHHDQDERYNTIILHVVGKSDLSIQRENGETIPQIELELEKHVMNKYKLLKQSDNWIRCKPLWEGLNKDFLQFQLSHFIYERIYRKGKELLPILQQNKNDWATTFYHSLIKSFGMRTNALPFELTGKSTPLRAIVQEKADLRGLEALLLGQAHLINENPRDSYEADLKKRYEYQARKHTLRPIDSSLWKFGRMRPANFPHIKIVQFADLLHHSEHLFSKIKEAKELDDIRILLKCQTSSYWENHYVFGKETKRKSKHLDSASIDSLIINAVVPLYFLYAERHEDEVMQERCLKWLEQIPPEKNKIIEGWESIGQKASNAYQTQALIELKTQYCNLNKCLHCSIGQHLLCRKTERECTKIV